MPIDAGAQGLMWVLSSTGWSLRSYSGAQQHWLPELFGAQHDAGDAETGASGAPEYFGCPAAGELHGKSP